MSVMDLLFGRPLSTSEERGERLGAVAGIPVFGLDALSSAAYGPEAALTLLIALGAAGVAYIVPITLSIVVLLLIVYFSYRQTIAAYPKGGGSYTVAGQNLGPFAGLLAASALMIDYVLTAAVGISAGVGALISAVPSLEPHTLELCLLILVAITLVNLRGVRETGVVFMIPTYLFVGTLLITLVLGAVKTLAAGGHPTPVEHPALSLAASSAVGLWLLLKAFASGCTAMTGVEAVSNGVSAFREPVVKSAQRTLTIIIALLTALLLGIAYLSRAYGVGATDPGPGYQSVLSQLTAAVVGRNGFYYLTIASILLVLSLSANTAFADFPRLCRLIAQDGYLPNPFAVRGRRLVYTFGIGVLAVLCAGLLILFDGVTDRLIPLFAIGAFLAFTLSQAGMVVHWMRNKGPGWRMAMLINAVGAAATGATVCIVTITKFTSGAWITILLIPTMMATMFAIHRHYCSVNEAMGHAEPLTPPLPGPPVVIVPVVHWNQVSRAGLPCPQITIVQSPYRFVIYPIVDYVLELQKQRPGKQIAVIVPELVERRWHDYFLHNQRAKWLKAALLLKGNSQIMVINVPWYLER